MNELELIEDGDTGHITAKCPVCDKVIWDNEGCIEDIVCKHVKMIFVDVCSMSYFFDNKVKSAMADAEKKDEDVEVVDFMKKYAKKNDYEIWTATQSGIACGPVSNTDYYMIKFPTKKAKKTKK